MNDFLHQVEPWRLEASRLLLAALSCGKNKWVLNEPSFESVSQLVFEQARGKSGEGHIRDFDPKLVFEKETEESLEDYLAGPKLDVECDSEASYICSVYMNTLRQNQVENVHAQYFALWNLTHAYTSDSCEYSNQVNFNYLAILTIA